MVCNKTWTQVISTFQNLNGTSDLRHSIEPSIIKTFLQLELVKTSVNVSLLKEAKKVIIFIKKRLSFLMFK